MEFKNVSETKKVFLMKIVILKFIYEYEDGKDDYVGQGKDKEETS